MLTFYQGYDNVQTIQLTSDDVVQSMLEVTLIEITFDGVTYDSDTSPYVFDWTTDPTELVLRMGLLPDIPVAKDKKAEIVTYDPSNPNGLVWGRIAIKIDEVT
jgi:hypothetical protein